MLPVRHKNIQPLHWSKKSPPPPPKKKSSQKKKVIFTKHYEDIQVDIMLDYDRKFVCEEKLLLGGMEDIFYLTCPHNILIICFSLLF